MQGLITVQRMFGDPTVKQVKYNSDSNSELYHNVAREFDVHIDTVILVFRGRYMCPSSSWTSEQLSASGINRLQLLLAEVHVYLPKGEGFIVPRRASLKDVKPLVRKAMGNPSYHFTLCLAPVLSSYNTRPESQCLLPRNQRVSRVFVHYGSALRFEWMSVCFLRLPKSPL